MFLLPIPPRQDLTLAHYNYFCLDCEDCSDNSSSSSNSGECDHTSHARRTLKDIEEVAAHIKSTQHSKFQPVQNFVKVKERHFSRVIITFKVGQAANPFMRDTKRLFEL